MEPVNVGSPTPEQKGWAGQFSYFAADALRYWEPRRLVYNAVLGLIVLLHFALALPAARSKVTPDLVLGIFVLGVLANVCYCTVYVPDLFVQFAGLRGGLKVARLALLGVGTALAAVLTHFFTVGMFR